MAHIMSNKEDIIEYIKSLIAGGLSNGALEVNSGHIYGGIANSAASPASEPVLPDHTHIQSPSIVENYEVRRQRERQIAQEEREARLLAIHERLEQPSENGGQSENVEQNKRQERQIRRYLERAEKESEELRLTVEKAKRRLEEIEVDFPISLDRFKESVASRNPWWSLRTSAITVLNTKAKI